MMRPGYQYSRIKGVLLLASAFALIPMIATDAAGIQMDVIPSARLQEEWQSNVFSTNTNEVSSFGTRLTPGLALKFTSVNNVVLQVSGNYEKVWYYKPEAKEADYNAFFFRVDSTGEWKLTPTISMLPSVYYVNTTNSSRRTQLVPSGDPVVPPVAITNYGNTTTEDFGGGAGFHYLATPNLTIGLAGNYGEQRFKDSTSGSGLTNSKTAGGGASVSYTVTPKTSIGIGGSYSRQTNDNNSDFNTLSGNILLGYQFSPALRLDTTFGISRASQSAAAGVPEENNTTPSGGFNLTYSNETFTAKAFGSLVYTGGSGFGQATRQSTAGLALSDQFAREWTWNLSGTYQISRSVFVSDAVDLKTYYGTAGISYKPWQWVAFDLSGGINRQTSSGLLGDTLTNSFALLGVTVEKPYKIF
jgi:hypothetical protein